MKPNFNEVMKKCLWELQLMKNETSKSTHRTFVRFQNINHMLLSR